MNKEFETFAAAWAEREQMARASVVGIGEYILSHQRQAGVRADFARVDRETGLRREVLFAQGLHTLKDEDCVITSNWLGDFLGEGDELVRGGLLQVIYPLPDGALFQGGYVGLVVNIRHSLARLMPDQINLHKDVGPEVVAQVSDALISMAWCMQRANPGAMAVREMRQVLQDYLFGKSYDSVLTTS